MKRARRTSGFTLLEVMVALLVLAFASVGAIVSILAASKELREGQLKAHVAGLVDARIQRARLTDKLSLYSQAVTSATTPDTVAVGIAPWIVDAAEGALFRVLPDGTITSAGISDGGTSPSSCGDGAIGAGVFCREVAITQGASVADAGGIMMSGTLAATVWVRVSRKGEPLNKAILSRTVIAQ